MRIETGDGSRSDAMGDPRMALPLELREALDREIDPGERLRWCGQPDPWRKLVTVLPLLFFAAVFISGVGGLMVFVGISTWPEVLGMEPAKNTDVQMLFYLFLVVAVLLVVAAARVCRHPWIEIARARRTIFALTNTRVFILEMTTDGRANLTAFEPSHPLAISRVEHRGGTGTVALNLPPYDPGRAQSQTSASIVLVGVREPRVVERLIRQTFDPPAVK